MGGDVLIAGAVSSGRDTIIGQLTVLAGDGPPAGDVVTRPADGGPCPYPGLAAFDRDRVAYFHGRRADGAALLRMLGRGSLVAVVGSSGSGKSSLLAAGVLPALKADALPGSATWRVQSFRPGEQPVARLAEQIANALPGVTSTEAAASIIADPHSVLTYGQRIAQATGSRLVWVIDQLEEVFHPSVPDVDRAVFLAALAAHADAQPGDVQLLIALRSDFYPHLDTAPALARAVAEHQVRLARLGPEGIREAVIRPAEQVGLRVEPELVEQIVRDAVADGRESSQPLLGYALECTWRARRGGWLTLAGYTASGGVSGAVARAATEVWECELDDTGRQAARRIFRRLAYRGDETTAPTRRRRYFAELVTDLDDEATVFQVVEAFVRHRLLAVDLADGKPTVEVCHESLLTAWPVLRGWLDDERDAAIIRDDLAQATASWHDGGRNAGYLFRGTRLARAVALRDSGDLPVNSREARFLAVSRHLEARERRRLLLQRVLPVALALTLAVTGVVVRQQRQTEQARATADALRLAAQARSVAVEHRDLGVLLGVAAYHAQDSPDTKAALIDLVSASTGPLDYPPFPGATATALASSFGPGGELVAGGSDGSVRWLSPGNGAEETARRTRDHTAPVTVISVAPDGTTISGDSGGVLVVRDPTGARRAVTSLDDGVIDLGFDPRRRIVFAASSVGTVERWRLGSGGTDLTPVDQRRVPGSRLVVDPASGQFVVTTRDGVARRWNSDTGIELPPLPLDTDAPADLAPLGDGRLAVLEDRRLVIWDLRAESPRSTSTAVASPTALASAGARLYVGSADAAVTDFSTDGTPAQVGGRRAGLAAAVRRLATDGAVLAGLDGDGHLATWSLSGAVSPAMDDLGQQDASVQDARYGPAGTLAIVTGSGAVRVRTNDGWRTVLTVPVGASPTRLAWTGPAELAVGGTDGTVRTVDISSGTSRQLPGTGSGAIAGLASGNGRLAIAYLNRDVVVVDHGRSPTHRRAAAGRVTALALSEDGRRLAVASGQGTQTTISLWSDLDHPTPARLLRGHRLLVASLAFAPNGRTLASGSDDQAVRLWSVPDGKPLRTLLGHTDMIRGLAFTPDGRTLASGGEDSTIRIWDIDSGKALGQPLRVDNDIIWALTATPDGRWLAAADGYAVRRWPFTMPAWVHRACVLAGRNLAAAERAAYLPGADSAPLCPARGT